MSNRLTFSLASLILIFALAAMPATAQTKTIDIPTGSTAIPVNNFGVVAGAETFGSAGSTLRGTGAIDIGIGSGAAADLTVNLEERFRAGVTLALIAPIHTNRDGTSSDDTNTGDVIETGDILAKDVVISEIMWGLDDAADDFNNQDVPQYIELYNTTTAETTGGAVAVDVSSWKFYLVDTHSDLLKADGSFKMIGIDGNNDNDTADANEMYMVIDTVSNLPGAGGGWSIDTGDTGRSGRIVTATNNATAMDLISMYRNINYDNVQKADHEKDTDADNRKEQLKAVPNGHAKGSWKNSTRGYDTQRVGTPGAQHFKANAPLTASSVDRSKVIINEIGNYPGGNFDWIEILNLTAADYDLKNHHISQVLVDDDDAHSDVSLVNFKDVTDVKVPANGVLLIVSSDPDKNAHPIAGGINVKDGPGDHEAKGSQIKYYIDPDGFDIPNDPTLIILRNKHDQLGKAAAFLDVVGGLSRSDTSAARATSLWPLIRTGAAHGNVIDTVGRAFKENGVYRRDNKGGGTGDKHWKKSDAPGIGYKRRFDTMSAAYSGTPGYVNDAVKAKATDLENGAADIAISEVMYQLHRNAPQWIELYNTSRTEAVNLEGWTLKIENDEDDSGVDIRTPAVTITLPKYVIPPNQPLLLVSTTTTTVTDEIDVDHGIIDFWGTKDIKDKLEASSRRYQLLSTSAFRLTLMQKDAKAGDDPVDVAGNLGADPAWELPMMDEEAEGRSSIIRRYVERYDENGDPVTDGIANDGIMAKGWVAASMTDLSLQKTYYGNRNDLGTPGFHTGGALPVSLSKFRPERLDSGEIVVRWVTESELNNAGFNILRSETRDGQFTKLNTQLIAGQGTTSEKNAYEFVDKTAKPNVVYYYQIQDVSIDGDVTTLRTTHLRGNVSAAGKLTTTWGELKALQ